MCYSIAPCGDCEGCRAIAAMPPWTPGESPGEGRRREPVHGPGTYNGAVLADPHRLSRRTDSDGVTVHEHGVAGAVILTHRTPRHMSAFNGPGWEYEIRRGDWSTMGYCRRQSEALAVAVGKLCRAVDAGLVAE